MPGPQRDPNTSPSSPPGSPDAAQAQSDTTPDFPAEWFARPDGPEGGAGLRFGCTLCGNCCSGPSGYVHLDEAEIDALARRLFLSRDEFLRAYTKHIPGIGISLIERPHPADADGNTTGAVRYDCVFLDRTTIPGRAVCGVYQDRPRQCRTWPFWTSVIRSEAAWRAAGRTCPGLNTGELHTVMQIRIARDTIDI